MGLGKNRDVYQRMKIARKSKYKITFMSLFNFLKR